MQQQLGSEQARRTYCAVGPAQMPRGVPVATVAIGNAANAGLLAVRILASSDADLLRRMLEYQAGMKETVLAKAERLESRGWQHYTL